MTNDCQLRLKNFNWIKYFGSDHLKEERAKKLECKSPRINVLAQPKYLTKRIVWKMPKDRKVQIIREYKLPTRIKMLAIPKVRRLVSSLKEYKSFISENRIKNYDELIQKSIMTMYSRLANVHIKKKQRSKKWTKDDWQRNCQWMQKRALPKVYKEELPLKKLRKSVPLKQLQNSIFALSKPRRPRQKYRKTFGYKSYVKDSAKFFIPSERLLSLAKPKIRFRDENEDEDDEEFNPWQVNPNALKFRASDRLIRLATPKTKATVYPMPSISEFGVLKRALKASLSKRTEEISKPKIRETEERKEKPLVSKSALKAKATPRIIQLAIPRTYI